MFLCLENLGVEFQFRTAILFHIMYMHMLQITELFDDMLECFQC